jgi:hypothetical protein
MQRFNHHLDIEEAPIVAELNAAGYLVTDFWDLRHFAGDKTKAYEIIFKHINLGNYSDMVMSRLPGALNTKEAAIYLDSLINLYNNSNNLLFKDGLARSIVEIILSAKHMEGFSIAKKIILNEQHGDSRIYFLDILKKTKTPESISLIKELRNNPTFTREISSWKSFWKRNE